MWGKSKVESRKVESQGTPASLPVTRYSGLVTIMAKGTSAVAWQGITISAPDDWSLVGVSGDKKKGYFRVDGPHVSAVEVRWSLAHGKAPDLAAKARELLANLESGCRKRRPAVFEQGQSR